MFAFTKILLHILKNPSGDSSFSRFRKDLSLEVKSPFSVVITTTLFTSLDNAVESAVQTSSPFIKLAILKYNAFYTICVENSYKGKAFLKESSGTLITTKSDRALHGYGTQIISDIAQMYDGSYSWEAQEYKFVSTVLLKI